MAAVEIITARKRSNVCVGGGGISEPMSFHGGVSVTSYLPGGGWVSRGQVLAPPVEMSRGGYSPSGVGMSRMVGGTHPLGVGMSWVDTTSSPVPDTWDTTRYSQQTGGTHPIGMFSCFR